MTYLFSGYDYSDYYRRQYYDRQYYDYYYNNYGQGYYDEHGYYHADPAAQRLVPVITVVNLSALWKVIFCFVKTLYLLFYSPCILFSLMHCTAEFWDSMCTHFLMCLKEL